MTAEVTLLLPLGSERNAYVIPLLALSADQDRGGQVFVFDATTSTVKKKAVTITGFRDNSVIVASGVNAGDVIATAGVSFLEDGQKVKLLESTASPQR